MGITQSAVVRSSTRAKRGTKTMNGGTIGIVMLLCLVSYVIGRFEQAQVSLERKHLGRRYQSSMLALDGPDEAINVTPGKEQPADVRRDFEEFRKQGREDIRRPHTPDELDEAAATAYMYDCGC